MPEHPDRQFESPDNASSESDDELDIDLNPELTEELEDDDELDIEFGPELIGESEIISGEDQEEGEVRESLDEEYETSREEFSLDSPDLYNPPAEPGQFKIKSGPEWFKATAQGLWYRTIYGRALRNTPEAYGTTLAETADYVNELSRQKNKKIEQRKWWQHAVGSRWYHPPVWVNAATAPIRGWWYSTFSPKAVHEKIPGGIPDTYSEIANYIDWQRVKAKRPELAQSAKEAAEKATIQHKEDHERGLRDIRREEARVKTEKARIKAEKEVEEARIRAEKIEKETLLSEGIQSVEFKLEKRKTADGLEEEVYRLYINGTSIRISVPLNHYKERYELIEGDQSQAERINERDEIVDWLFRTLDESGYKIPEDKKEEIRSQLEKSVQNFLSQELHKIIRPVEIISATFDEIENISKSLLISSITPKDFLILVGKFKEQMNKLTNAEQAKIIQEINSVNSAIQRINTYKTYGLRKAGILPNPDKKPEDESEPEPEPPEPPPEEPPKDSTPEVHEPKIEEPSEETIKEEDTTESEPKLEKFTLEAIQSLEFKQKDIIGHGNSYVLYVNNLNLKFFVPARLIRQENTAHNFMDNSAGQENYINQETTRLIGGLRGEYGIPEELVSTLETRIRELLNEIIHIELQKIATEEKVEIEIESEQPEPPPPPEGSPENETESEPPEPPEEVIEETTDIPELENETKNLELTLEDIETLELQHKDDSIKESVGIYFIRIHSKDVGIATDKAIKESLLNGYSPEYLKKEYLHMFFSKLSLFPSLEIKSDNTEFLKNRLEEIINTMIDIEFQKITESIMNLIDNEIIKEKKHADKSEFGSKVSTKIIQLQYSPAKEGFSSVYSSESDLVYRVLYLANEFNRILEKSNDEIQAIIAIEKLLTSEEQAALDTAIANEIKRQVQISKDSEFEGSSFPPSRQTLVKSLCRLVLSQIKTDKK